MADPRFFDRAGPFTVNQLAQAAGVVEIRTPDADALITDVAPLDKAGPGQLSFLDNRRYADQLAVTGAGAVLLAPAFADRASEGTTLLLTPEPYRAYARCAQLFYPDRSPVGGIHPTAVIDPSALVGEDCTIEAYAVIGPAARIGPRCWLGPHSVVGAGVALGSDCRLGAHASVTHALLGDRVRIYSGARVGQDGFGFAMGADGFTKVPQLGRVILEDDVEVGANSTIDRGAGPDTVIGQGTMIDNLVQVGHNVQAGRNCVLVSQSGVAGSTRLGNFVVLAAQAGVAGHITLSDGVRLGAKSGIHTNLEAPGDYVGAPAMPARQFWKEQVALRRLLAAATQGKQRHTKAEDDET